MTVGDAATISGGDNASGNVTFTLYKDASCTQTEGVSGSGAIRSEERRVGKERHTLGAPGTYYRQASYAGDANNNGLQTACSAANEQLTVGKASLSVKAEDGMRAVTVTGVQTCALAVSISGGDNASGNVTFTLYKDASCTQTEGVSGSGAI